MILTSMILRKNINHGIYAYANSASAFRNYIRDIKVKASANSF